MSIWGLLAVALTVQAFVIMWLLLAAPLTPVQAQPAAATDVVPRGSAAVPLLREIWSFAADNIYPKELAAHFNTPQLALLEQALRHDPELPLADAINPFLLSLGVSHTEFFDRRHHSYYMLKSLFGTRTLDAPRLYLLGLLLDARQPGRIHGVLDGSPAALAGIVPNEYVVAVDGMPFSSLLQWQQSEPVTLTVRSAAGKRQLELTPVYQGLHRALLDATIASDRVLACETGTVGYLHLWSGTNDAFLGVLEAAIGRARKRTDVGFVLDLRGGFGGAWWPYLDAFFADRSSYFEASRFDREVRGEVLRAEPETNTEAYLGPLAVLINGGTRSGKESLAWQFRKTSRGRLFGETTAGAFTAGMGVFAERDAAYLLYLSVAELRLDGVRIEGAGVRPDERVARSDTADEPLERALMHLGCGAAAAKNAVQ